MAYRLQLPEGSRIHPIFHVSKLKRHIGDAPNMMPDLPVVNEDAEIVACPEAVLSQRILLRKGRQILQVLIRWLNLQPEDATWEDASFIRAQFPDFQLPPSTTTVTVPASRSDPCGQGSSQPEAFVTIQKSLTGFTRKL